MDEGVNNFLSKTFIVGIEIKISHSWHFTLKEHDLPTNRTTVFNQYLQQFHNIKNKPHCIRFQISLSPVTSNECIIFQTKYWIVKLMGHGLNYNSKACWTWITLSTMCHYEMQKKKKWWTQRQFHPKNTLIPSHLVGTVRDLF